MPDNLPSPPQGNVPPVSAPGRLADIAASLRRTDRTGSREKIDRLLRAMAEKDTTFRKDASKNAGDIAVAIDSILRWIGKAEGRLAAIVTSQTGAGNAQPAISIAGIETAISALEERLDGLERRMETLQLNPPVSEIETGKQQLESRASQAEPSTEKAPGRYFDLVASQIGALEDELRRKTPSFPETGRMAAQEKPLSERDNSNAGLRAASGGKAI